jgi:hypothetical protein
MDAVSKEVITLIKNLLTLESLKAFALAGGKKIGYEYQFNH